MSGARHQKRWNILTTRPPHREAPRAHGNIVPQSVLEIGRAAQTAGGAGIKTMYELAFFRTGCLVSANASDVDDEIQPEGMKAVFEDSTDPYHKEHGIRKFRDLLNCYDDC